MTFFSPMLASAVKDFSGLRFPLMGSPKFDGFRMVISDGKALSRNMKPIRNKALCAIFSDPILNGLDGELIAGPIGAPDAYTRTSSVVTQVDGPPDAVFHAFDDASRPTMAFEDRHKRLAHGVRQLWNIQPTLRPYIMPVGQVLLRDGQAVLDYEAQMLRAGFEGIMLRDPCGIYKFGRSTVREAGLMKLKRFEDSEAEVLGTVEQQANMNGATRDAMGHTKRSSHKAGKVPKGTLGALLVRDLKTKVEFEIGTGFTEAQRAAIWGFRRDVTGRIVTYRFQPAGVKEKPRFPTFMRFRDASDIGAA